MRAADAAVLRRRVSLGFDAVRGSRYRGSSNRLCDVLFYRRPPTAAHEESDLSRPGARSSTILGSEDRSIALPSPQRDLRVGLHVVSRHAIMPRLPEFIRRHPDLRIEMRLLVQPQTCRRRFDCSSNGRRAPDQGLSPQARHLNTGLSAPAYIEVRVCQPSR